MHTHAAGKGVNVAQVLADLGHQLTVSGFLGEDNLQAFETLFAKRGFVDAFIRVPGRPAAISRSPNTTGASPTSTARARWSAQRRSRRCLSVCCRSLRGMTRWSSPAVCRVASAAVVAALIERLKGLGLKVALDTSGEALRAGLEAPVADQAEHRRTRRSARLRGGFAAAEAQAAACLHAKGIEHVVISHGADGVNWFSVGSALHATPPKVTVASTVGAGDSLLAGMLHGLLSADTPEQTLRRATAIAAMAVTQIGFGISDAAQLAQLEQGVRVRPLTEQ
jgi:1-phosphofructokinase